MKYLISTHCPNPHTSLLITKYLSLFKHIRMEFLHVWTKIFKNIWCLIQMRYIPMPEFAKCYSYLNSFFLSHL